MAIFAPRKGKRVAPASQVTRRTREREVTGYLEANPQATRRQAQRVTAAQRRRGYVPQTISEQRATLQEQQRAQQYAERAQRSRDAAQRRITGGGIARDYDAGYTADIIYRKIQQSYIAQNQPLIDALIAGGTLPPGGTVASVSFEFNRQVVVWNMQNASPGDRVWAVDKATGSQIRHRAADANRRGNQSVWFYHNDRVSNGF
jgi:hypothetical protein